MPPLPTRKGLTAVYLLESLPADVPRTAEHDIRGMDARADCVLLVCGYDIEVVKALVAAELGELEPTARCRAASRASTAAHIP
jgi:hypothetical protein